MGMRVDHSARSVITPDAQLELLQRVTQPSESAEAPSDVDSEFSIS